MRHWRWMLSAWVLLWMATAQAARPPALELVDVYPGHLDLSRYWVSEKFDGVRGYWDGRQLWTRGGQHVDVPDWFTAGWPDTAMDGELWVGYGKFSHASAIVRSADADAALWHEVSYHVFDLPGRGGGFDARVPAIRKVVARIDEPWVRAIRQFHVADGKALQAALKRVLDKGGEGLVLHRGDAAYEAGRGVGLYKLKPYRDAEAKVIGVHPGQGRLDGMMGSLQVRTPEGREFAIGTGFSDAERADPPRIGAWITYRYNGLTATGLPRFARFLHMRPGGPPPE